MCTQTKQIDNPTNRQPLTSHNPEIATYRFKNSLNSALLMRGS
jgi:hypothetical protein